MPVTNYIWDVVSDNVLMEKDDDDGTIARYVQEPNLYGEAISQERGGQTRYYHYDGEGNTCELTDENENVTDSYEYSAFGEEVARNGTTVNPFGYKGALGYYANPETNDVYVRARTYEPKIARWLALDPIGFVDVVNRYIYARNNALWFQDSSGLECSPPTAVGANYVGGRGAFSFPPQWGNPMTTGLINIPGWLEPMYLLAEWLPDPAKFVGTDCCCCDEIGWIQIIKENGEYYGLAGIIAEIRDNHDWQIDGGIPYPGGSSDPDVPKLANPCRSPAHVIGFGDQPGRPKRTLVLIPWLAESYLRQWSFKAEACVACLQGTEGPKAVAKVESPDVQIVEKSFAIYGCVQWGFSVKRDRDGTFQITHYPVTTGGPDTGAWQTAMTSKTPIYST